MQFKQSTPNPLNADFLKTFFFFLVFFPLTSISQTTYLPKDAKEYILMERLEIQRQKDSCRSVRLKRV